MNQELENYIELKLASMGFSNLSAAQDRVAEEGSEVESLIRMSSGLLHSLKERTRKLANKLPPADQIIQDFLESYFNDAKDSLQLPVETLTMDREGMARICSLPAGGNRFQNGVVDSYRVLQGVLHNPKNDRRTTKGTFHIVEGGLPVPFDKIETPKVAFEGLFRAAMNPPEELLQLPFTSGKQGGASTFVSLYLRPVVCPAVPGVLSRKTMAIRFFAPGSLVSNLDFVESIFGNGGDPELASSNPQLDLEHWSGHTGCIILAPHLTTLRKIDLGLPHKSQATERQIRDGMCYESEDELYNNGSAFKITVRNEQGVVVTIIADNYFGYSKKEVKTQISYAANLLGLVEEEHAGGTLVFPRRGIQGNFIGELFSKKFQEPPVFQEVLSRYREHMDLQSEGYAIDKNYPELVYIPEDSFIDIYKGVIQWKKDSHERSIPISPLCWYMFPTGHILRMEKNRVTGDWQLISTEPEGIFCHKPATVSGGGKSEISKKLDNAIRYGSFHVRDLKNDFEMVETIADFDYSKRWKSHLERTKPSRPIFSRERTLGSVVKLLTPSSLYTDEYNSFLANIPHQVRSLILFVKLFYRKEIHGDWRGHLGVDTINGREGHDLKFNNRRITASYLRMGYGTDGTWFLHALRPDFIPASKIQLEDDITASVSLPSESLAGLKKNYGFPGAKLVENCERRFFQRPDEAIHPGYDQEAERDLSLDNLFITNFEPLKKEDVRRIVNGAVQFDTYSKAMQERMLEFLASDQEYMVVSSRPRLVDGKPSKNPRYLQTRHTEESARDEYIAEMATRLARKLSSRAPVHTPVNGVLSSRRNNPAETDKGIRSLAVYSPLHFQELPELFMDYVCSLTGKSPSTTGAGSEGALTKGPFNMLVPATDLNNALVSMILNGYHGFTTAAGYVGETIRFDHDISIFIPEIWARLREEEKDPSRMIQEESLEKLEDYDHNGKRILASRLGYRITEGFLFRYFNRVFTEPQAVFTAGMLRPELQDPDQFADGVNNIVEAQKRVAEGYFEDGSVEACVPPLKALLHIMVHGQYEGKTIEDPAIRNLFDRQAVLASDWYAKRLERKQSIDIQFYRDRIEYMKLYMNDPSNGGINKRMNLEERLAEAHSMLTRCESGEYLDSLKGTIGADPLFRG